MTPAPSADLQTGGESLVGRTLGGRYLIESQIGEGGMAAVYRAIATGATGEGPVAVKVLHRQLTCDESVVPRFEREANLARRISHPNIVKVLDQGSDGDLHFLVMELLEGEDLFDRLARVQRLDERTAVHIAAEVCDALAVAHREGIVHRDLKPENVFLVREPGGGEGVRVLDFGIAKRNVVEPRSPAGASTPNLTMVGAMLGTPEYMSPEQCKAETPGPRSDLYACGALLYTMLTGRPPFVGTNPVEIGARHIGLAPAPPSAHRPDLDPRLEAVVLRALSKDPDDRQPSASVLGETLRALLVAPPPPVAQHEAPSNPGDRVTIPDWPFKSAPPGASPASVVSAASMVAARAVPVVEHATVRSGRRSPAQSAVVVAAVLAAALAAGIALGRARATHPGSAPSAKPSASAESYAFRD